MSNGGSVDDESVAQAIYQNGYEPSPPSPEPYNIERLKSEAHQLGVSTDLLGQVINQVIPNPNTLVISVRDRGWTDRLDQTSQTQASV